MKTTPIPVIFDNLENGTALGAVAGKITRLYAEKSGMTNPTDGSKPKPWSLQNGELTDTAGNIIPFCFKDNPQDVGWKDHDVVLCGHHGDKGLSGLYVWDDPYEGKNIRKLKITGTGKIVTAQDFFAANEGTTTAANLPPPQRQQPGPSQQRQQPQPQQHRQQPAQAPQRGPQQQPGPSQQHRPQQQAPRPQAPPAPARKTSQMGVTVGMALNNAAAFIREALPVYAASTDPKQQLDYLKSRSFTSDVWELASQFLRIAEFLEQNKLAPRFGEEPQQRHNPATTQNPPQRQPQPQQRPAPQPQPAQETDYHHDGPEHQGQGPQPDGLDDDEIPF